MKQETLASLDETQRTDAFRRALNDHRNDESFLESLPRLIQTKVFEIEKEASGLNQQCESLNKKILGYNHLFAEVGHETVAMDQ